MSIIGAVEVIEFICEITAIAIAVLIVIGIIGIIIDKVMGIKDNQMSVQEWEAFKETIDTQKDSEHIDSKDKTD